MSEDAKPRLFKTFPAYKDYLWGGERLKKEYNKNTELGIVAESWELSTHPDGESYMGGEPLSQFIVKNDRLLGCKESKKDIPILIKLIDAKERLSVQVHPDDDYASTHEEDNGKTEAWVIMDCIPGAYVYYGVIRKITKEEFKQRIQAGTIEEVLRKVYVKKGDVLLINPGTIHAIGAGILLCEIQQKSNVTYRIYDFDRIGNDGNKRELHIDKACETSKLEPNLLNTDPEIILCKNDEFIIECLSKTNYFSIYRYTVCREVKIGLTTQLFHALTILNGSCLIQASNESYQCVQGETIFLPASAADIVVNGACGFILSSI
ncbi:MAG: mannose-6-phosphate isomerase, class I [Anaerorhabdus sp.]